MCMFTYQKMYTVFKKFNNWFSYKSINLSLVKSIL